MERERESPILVSPAAETSSAFDAEQRFAVDYSMPAYLEARLRVAEGNTPQGPLICLRAALALSVLEAQLIFRIPRENGRTGEIERHITIVSPDTRIARPEERLSDLVVGSLVTIRLIDQEHRPLVSEQAIGHCLDGTHEIVLPLKVDTAAAVWVSVGPPQEGRWPVIELRGELTLLRGVTLQLGTRQRHAQPQGDTRGTGICLVRPGTTWVSPRVAVEERIPVHSQALLRLIGVHGRSIGSERLIGRVAMS